MSDLHGDIMNIPCDPTRSPVGGVNAELAYKYGHRDARHAAAELASAHHAERAKPAEAEGVAVVAFMMRPDFYSPYVSITRDTYCTGAVDPLVRQSDHLAALSVVTAERDRLRDEMGILWKRIDKYESHSHGITALAEIERLREERDSQQRVCIAEMEKGNQLRAEVEGLRKDAERYRWLRDEGFAHADVSLGTDCDGENFVSYRISFHLPETAHGKFEDDDWSSADVDAAIDAALAAKEA